MKAIAYWNSSEYMNIYLVKEIYTCSAATAGCPADQGVGVAGYAYLSSAHGTTYDGVVNEAAWFGTNTNNSKVHIHEVGHYLNLSHTFYEPIGSGCQTGSCYSTGDNVCDTPPDNSATAVNCGTGATANTCSNDASLTGSPFSSDVQDIYEDYMDYGYQSCQNTFTPGQKSRMRQALFTTRKSLLSSTKCGSANSWVDAALTSINSPGAGSLCSMNFTPQVAITNGGTTTITAMVITATVGGGSAVVNNWSGSLTPAGITNFSLTSMTLPTNTAQSLVIQITSINGQGIDTYEENNNLSMTVGPSINQTAPTAACSMSSTNTGTATNWTMGISNVTIGSINSSSGLTYADGSVYVDKTCAQTTTLSAANTAISVTVGSLNDERVRVYIDLNNDGTFQTTEHLLTLTGRNTLTGFLPIPCTGTTFNTLLRMRVVSDFINNTSVACTTPQYGQVEDYGVIIPSTIFTLTAPTAAGCTITATNAGTSSNFNMGITNVTIGSINSNSGPTYADGAVYFDKTCAQTTTLSAANTAISVTVGGSNDERVRVYIDLNNDGTFQTTEHLLTLIGRNTLSGVLPIPCTGTTFNTLLRMRVVSDFIGNASVACTTPQYGQIEDYGVIIPSSIFTLAAPTAVGCTIAATNGGTGATNYDMGIRNVTYNTINYSSASTNGEGKVYFDRSCAIYTTFSSPTVSDVVTANISVTLGGGSNIERLRIYIDLNNNGSFADSGEEMTLTNPTGTGILTNSITIPNTVTRNRLLKMRVVSDFNSGTGASAACTTPTYGQIEDYGVYIATVLSLELTHLTAVNKDKYNLLDWKTATETNNSHFKIQKSKDGSTFTDIGTVKGSGTTTTPQYYTFKDDSPFKGINYYRLKMVDNDGKEEFSKIVSVLVSPEGKNGVTVYPNPTHNILTVEHTPSVETLEIVNTLGQVLKMVKPSLNITKTEIGTTELASGIYFLRVNQSEMIRFVKL
jgi:Pregnancy-associated plasma protein-A/GEVED domain/Secretion system C-terminal sorting domain